MVDPLLSPIVVSGSQRMLPRAHLERAVLICQGHLKKAEKMNQIFKQEKKNVSERVLSELLFSPGVNSRSVAGVCWNFCRIHPLPGVGPAKDVQGWNVMRSRPCMSPMAAWEHWK